MLGGREAFLYLRVCLNVGKKGDSKLLEEKYASAGVLAELPFICATTGD